MVTNPLGSIPASILSGFVFLTIPIHLFAGYCFLRMARRLGVQEKTWWVWVPFLQVLFMLKLANLKWGYLFLFLIPFVGAYVWIKKLQGFGKLKWLGVGMIIPPIDLFVLGYLAFSKQTDA
jgi:hypothetical protein